jgi:hypothetical protein
MNFIQARQIQLLRRIILRTRVVGHINITDIALPLSFTILLFSAPYLGTVVVGSRKPFHLRRLIYAVINGSSDFSLLAVSATDGGALKSSFGAAGKS